MWKKSTPACKLLLPCWKYSFNISQNICHEWYVSNTSFFPQYQYLKKPPFSGSSRIWKPSVHRSSSQSPAHPPAAIKCHRTSKQKTKLAEKISKSELFHQIVRRVSLSLIHGRSKQVGKSFIPQEFARILEWIYTYLICICWHSQAVKALASNITSRRFESVCRITFFFLFYFIFRSFHLLFPFIYYFHLLIICLYFLFRFKCCIFK